MPTNPYDPPQADDANLGVEPKRRPSVATLATATVGALLVFLGAFFALQLAGVFVAPFAYQTATGLIASYAITVPLAIAAAVMSFRATVRMAKK